MTDSFSATDEAQSLLMRRIIQKAIEVIGPQKFIEIFINGAKADGGIPIWREELIKYPDLAFLSEILEVACLSQHQEHLLFRGHLESVLEHSLGSDIIKIRWRD